MEIFSSLISPSTLRWWTDEMDEFVHEIQDKYGTRYVQKSIPFNFPSTIGHSLGELWICPAHVPKYGGQQTYFTESWMCISKEHGDTFPSALHSLLCLCIDDTKIWADACQRDVDAVERAQWMEENWPGGSQTKIGSISELIEMIRDEIVKMIIAITKMIEARTDTCRGQHRI